nr:hypothetical protein Iba_scaffold48146CG0010 [Ipomoea batatas]GME16947.1 hypothetical protein Iba_scaffold18157CG0020 [Ipomoea batatas]
MPARLYGVAHDGRKYMRTYEDGSECLLSFADDFSQLGEWGTDDGYIRNGPSRPEGARQGSREGPGPGVEPRA